MSYSHGDLTNQYEDFLRGERHNHIERIGTAVDDYLQLTSPTTPTKKRQRTTESICPRIRIPLTEIRSTHPSLATHLRTHPFLHFRALESACHSIALEERPLYGSKTPKIKVSICGPVSNAPYSPRQLTSSCLRQLVCIEGVATKLSAVKPKVVKSVHYCPKTKQHEVREYVDATDSQLGLNAIDSSGRELPDKMVSITTSVYPTKDRENNPLETEFGLSEYKDHQTCTLQEMPERAPMGQLPRSVDLVLEHDMVDKIKPGDRVQIVGVYRALATASSGQTSTSGLFRTVVIVNHVQILGRDVSNLVFSPGDIRQIRSLGRKKDILDVLGRSIAPSIHGHEVIKKALVLQLLCGVEKNLPNGTHIRGDVNILMVGDPSTAKSQLLRSAMQIAPLAVSTTGKGSSGVGLTAAVTSDPDTGERRLEAGAMVLADRGLVCVDEFDKMSEADRVTIHEAMEQQTVTIAKAGIHASLNARCAVLAAANPVYGQYDRRRRVQENIGLPDSLLSRFDLLFVVLDQLDPNTDRRIATHVIRGHRYRPVGVDDSDDESDHEEKNNSIWQKSHHAYTTKTAEDDDVHSKDVLMPDFLKKYLHFAKNRIQPLLTDDARECIAQRYAEMRSRQSERTLPITARSLETVIRLASAHAKARLSHKVEAEPDCRIAMDILSFALYHENHHEASEEMPTSNPNSGEDIITDKQSPISSPIKKKPRLELGMQKLKERIGAQIKEAGDQLEIEKVCEDIEDRFLIEKAVAELEKDNQVMMSDGILFII